MNSPIKLLLVPLDFSEYSEHALQYAQALAERINASLHLVHVVETPAIPGAWEFYTPDLGTLQEEMIADAQHRLTVHRLSLESQRCRVTTSVVAGYPSKAIADRASDIGADLIVMGTHGRTGFSHLLMGSVAERVVRIAPCPVLTVRDTATKADPARAEHAA